MDFAPALYDLVSWGIARSLVVHLNARTLHTHFMGRPLWHIYTTRFATRNPRRAQTFRICLIAVMWLRSHPIHREVCLAMAYKLAKGSVLTPDPARTWPPLEHLDRPVLEDGSPHHYSFGGVPIPVRHYYAHERTLTNLPNNGPYVEAYLLDDSACVDTRVSRRYEDPFAFPFPPSQCHLQEHLFDAYLQAPIPLTESDNDDSDFSPTASDSDSESDVASDVAASPVGSPTRYMVY
jgi:hypothetical protein